MISFQNKRQRKIQYIRNIQNTAQQLRVINLARQLRNKAPIEDINDSESVFDETSSVYDDLCSVNTDFAYTHDEVEYFDNSLETILEGEDAEEMEEKIVKCNIMTPFRLHLWKLEHKYRSGSIPEGYNNNFERI